MSNLQKSTVLSRAILIETIPSMAHTISILLKFIRKRGKLTRSGMPNWNGFERQVGPWNDSKFF